MIDKKNWTLLAIAAAEGKSLSPVQLQKAMFLLGDKLPADVRPDFYEFEPYHYGPFNAAVYSDAQALAGEGFVTINATGWGKYREYSATHDGLVRASAVAAELPAAVRQYVRDVVEWTRSMSFGKLVSEIYKLYPDMKAKSIFKDTPSAPST